MDYTSYHQPRKGCVNPTSHNVTHVTNNLQNVTHATKTPTETLYINSRLLCACVCTMSHICRMWRESWVTSTSLRLPAPPILRRADAETHIVISRKRKPEADALVYTHQHRSLSSRTTTTGVCTCRDAVIYYVRLSLERISHTHTHTNIDYNSVSRGCDGQENVSQIKSLLPNIVVVVGPGLYDE